MSWSGDVAICNGALAMLGAQLITSLAESSTQAILCNLFYSQCRDATLREYPWNFAVRRANLGAALSTLDPRAPVWGFTFGYSLPTDPYCLRVLDVEEDFVYRVEGRVLYSDAASPRVRYISRVTSAAEFDDNFKLALSAQLAVNLAMPLTKSTKMLEAMLALYGAQLDAARAVDTQEGTPEEIDSDELLDARHGSSLTRSQYLAR